MAVGATRSEHGNASSVLDRNVEQGRGDKAAVIAEDRTLSYDELRRAANRMGGLLRSLGAGREARVLMVLDDTSAFPVTFLGAMRVGAVPVPVSTLDSDDNFRHFVDDSYAEVVVAEAAMIPHLRTVLDDRPVRFVAAGGEVPDAIELWGALAEHEDELSPVAGHPDDVAFWLYSSGSTGRPKGVVHLHHDIAFTCERFAGRVLGIRESDVHFSTTKLQHAYGLGNGLTFPLHFGATSVLMSGRPKPQRILDTLRRHRPSVYFSVPALFALIARDPSADGALDSVRICVSAAEALPPATFDRFKQRFGLEIVDGIGSTEMLHIFCSNRPGQIVRGSTGTPVPGYELRIVDPVDDRVLDGEATGNLETRGDSCAAFYWHQHEKSKACMRGDWFTTGDRYRRDADGVYWYEGRADDMLKIGGLWVSPVDIEGTLMAHPSVLGVGVIGVEVEDQTRIAAYVIREPGRDSDLELAEQLRTWCKERMRRYEYPHLVQFVDDLPRTVNGKVQRFRLRELASSGGVSA
jgi:benzoate-CoA ligase family protein